MSRLLASLGLILVFAKAPAKAAEPVTRAQLVAAALATHPDQRAWSARVAAADLSARAATTTAPVMLSAGVAPLSLGTEMSGFDVAASWQVPGLGMGAAERDVAEATRSMTSAEAKMAAVALAAATSRAVDDLLAAREAVAVLDAHVAALGVVADAVDRQVAAALMPEVDRVMARMSVARAEVDALGAKRRYADAQAALTAFTGLDASAFDGLAPEPGPVLAGAGEGGAAPPADQMATADAAMREAMVAMTRAGGRPMIEPMLSYSSMWSHPMHRFMAGVGVGLPVDPRARARVDAARARADAAGLAATATTRASELAVTQASAMVDEARAMRAIMADQMVALAAEQARLRRVAWETGVGPIDAWLVAERELAGVRLDVVEAQASVRRAEAMLAMALGACAGLLDGCPP